MAKDSATKKASLLGMPFGTATQRLRKNVLFCVLQATGLDHCYRCGEPIESVDDLSMEHIVPWQSADDPKAVFFDVENISFSHLKCNVGAANREKTACPRGHEYTPENTYGQDKGERSCRRCYREYNRWRWHNKGGAAKRRERRHSEG